jgi:methane/ammonia monooxygenase subunit C
MAFVDILLNGRGNKNAVIKKEKVINAKKPLYANTVIYKYGNFGLFLVGILIVTGLVVGARIYQQLYGFSAGLDSMSPDFQKYWMTLVKAELIGIFSLNICIWAYLWFTRERDMDNVQPKTALKRYINLVLWILSYTFIVYWTTSFFAYADGAWHQTVLRDTSFTPSHNILFYGCIPLYLTFGVGGFLYAMTRLPSFGRAISVAYTFAVLGPALILPNLGFNEWGHAYWMTEEIFSHPLHWGFVVLGWNALAIGGVLMQIVIGMSKEFKKMQNSKFEDNSNSQFTADL